MAAGLRVALVADTHGFLDPRVADLVRHCDRVIHAGDIGDEAILAALDRPHAEVIAVAGNNDGPAQAQEHRLDLPKEAVLELPGGALAIIHGHQYPARDRHTRLRRRFPEAAAIVYGHSHRRVIDTSARPWILNPGAAGRQRAYGGPGCLLLAIDGEEWRVIERRFDPLPKNRPTGREL